MLEQLHRDAREVERERLADALAFVAVTGASVPPKTSSPLKAYRWLCWSLMLLAVGMFASSDVVANWLEGRGRGQAIDPVTATGWVRLGIRTTWYALPLVSLTLGWLVWHFIVGAFYPDLPL